jgi:hypothetical protein
MELRSSIRASIQRSSLFLSERKSWFHCDLKLDGVKLHSKIDLDLNENSDML